MPVDPGIPPPAGKDANIAARLAQLERELRNLKTFLNGGAGSQFPVVSTLAGLPAGRKGRGVFNSSDGKLYVDNGTAWVAQT